VKRLFPYLGLLGAVVVLDQVTKALISRSMDLHEYVPVIDGILSLSHVRNQGAAFGVLSNAGLPHQPVLLSAVSLVALAAIAVYFVRLPASARMPRIALSLVLGGAIGNLVDRVRLGYVVDFVHVFWRDHVWPDFNVADSAITVGVALLVLDVLRSRRGETTSAPDVDANPTPGRID
jgi:signal peptidase II